MAKVPPWPRRARLLLGACSAPPQVRDKLASLILATDFSVHGEIINQYNKLMTEKLGGGEGVSDAPEADGPQAREWDPTGHQREAPTQAPNPAEPTAPAADTRPWALLWTERMLCLKMAIKCGDLSYLAKDKGNGYIKVWTDRVLEEFFSQGDAEKVLVQKGALAWDRTRHRAFRRLPKG